LLLEHDVTKLTNTTNMGYISMNISLTLPASIKAWAQEQADVEVAILKVLESHIATTDSPTLRAARLLKDNARKMPDGMEFEIQQAIGREGWEPLLRSERLSLGKAIKRNPERYGLVFVRKTSSNHALYKRLES
jgi:hypothetical protein